MDQNSNKIADSETAVMGPFPQASCSASWLAARASIAGDLYREGRIAREECFRVEIDAMHNENTGPMKYEK
jgi:hypothetical protein